MMRTSCGTKTCYKNGTAAHPAKLSFRFFLEEGSTSILKIILFKNYIRMINVFLTCCLVIT